jgi:hypothetical protein
LTPNACGRQPAATERATAVEQLAPSTFLLSPSCLEPVPLPLLLLPLPLLLLLLLQDVVGGPFLQRHCCSWQCHPPLQEHGSCLGGAAQGTCKAYSRSDHQPQASESLTF